MGFAKRVCLGAIVAAAFVGWRAPAGAADAADAGAADDADQSLRLYAVHVVRVPKEWWTGNGIYLGNGLVITAGHIVGIAPWNLVQVQIAGKALTANILKRGQFQGVDLALLSVNDAQLPVSLRLRRMPVCRQSPWSGEDVIVATPENTARSHVVAPALLPRGLAPKFRTAIGDVASTGDSGSGVFDANAKCLLGIVSGKIQQAQTRQENGQTVRETHDVAKYFVPAATITEFIPPQYHF